MADAILSADMDAFLTTANDAAARTELGLDTLYVGLTGVQTIAGVKTFSDQLFVVSGTLANPGVAFTENPNTGFIYNEGDSGPESATNSIRAVINGSQRVLISETSVTTAIAGGFFLACTASGTASNPVYAFETDENTGWYRISADVIGITTAGVLRVTVRSAGVTATVPFIAPAGSFLAPSWTFAGDEDTGAYRISADAMGFVAGSTLQLRIDSTGVTVVGQLVVTSPSVPASASAAGVTGTICWDSSFIYVCVATNTWKRVAIATW